MRIKTGLLTVMLLLWTACGGSLAERTNKSLGTALSATNAASAQFTKWDKQHQLDIVDKASTRKEAEDGLREYRDKRQRIIQSFTVAYSSMASAAAMVPLVQAGEKSDADLIGLLAESVGAVQTVISSLKEIREAFATDMKSADPSPPVKQPPEADPPAAPIPIAAPIPEAA